MDSWNEKQINSMRLGGNDACNQFLMKYKVIPPTKDDTGHNIFQKYNSPAAALYKDRLRAIVEGREPPSDISKYQTASSTGGSNGSSGAAASGGKEVAQGSDPLPGESNDEYVARQRLLQVHHHLLLLLLSSIFHFSS